MNERKKNAAGAESVGVLTYRAKPLAKSLGIGVSTLWAGRSQISEQFEIDGSAERYFL